MMKSKTIPKLLVIAMALATVSILSSISSPKNDSFFIKSAAAETSKPIQSDSTGISSFTSEDMRYLLKGL